MKIPNSYYDLVESYPLVKDDPSLYKPGEILSLSRSRHVFYECVGLKDGQSVKIETLASSMQNPFFAHSPQTTFFVTETRRLVLYGERIEQHRVSLHGEHADDMDIEAIKQIVDASNIVHIIDGHITNHDPEKDTIKTGKVSLILENLAGLLLFHGSQPTIQLYTKPSEPIIFIQRETEKEARIEKPEEMLQLQFKEFVGV